ncbi:YegP family protein [Desulfovibrio subterraneus]|uniref:DUF1508 domain-containing protein n=1 Tax=Desulfovibrio subterraneus TaxID=2718620 RepID=A0A7J0BKN3_9BACT|nr:YegP family protein [Desulfovibrio subterraneus]GFM33752.1 hypothetical protein DSM101010T_21170 [Desulfovibrio subterraneus]
MSQCTDKQGYVWEFYKDSNDKWRWRKTATNGNIVGSSSQGYVNKSDCIDNARSLGCTCI